MKPENIIMRILRKLGIIEEQPSEKDIEESNRLKREMCLKAVRSNVCPNCCEKCAWNVLLYDKRS